MSLLTPGTLLQERYRVDRLIGHGGFGAVYEAIDVRLNRRIALKQQLRAGERLSRQFEREAQLLANLSHPSLPNVHDHFSAPDGQFLVMQYIPGDDLGALLLQRDAPFAVEQVLAWGGQLLDALNYLHSRQPPIIHRDIKPQNLKLTAGGTIMLLDFGLAKGFAGETPPSTVEHSLLAYTKGYAPPEQVEGLGTDERSDLYALSATLYCLLTNTAPVEAQTRLLAAARGRPDPLRAAHEINPAVPQAVSAVLALAMQLEREDRPQSAQAMRFMLDIVRDGAQPARPVEAAPVVSSEPTLLETTPAAPARTPAPVSEPKATFDVASGAYPATPPRYFRPSGPEQRVGNPSQPSLPRLPLILGGAGLLIALVAVLGSWFATRGRESDPNILTVSSAIAQASVAGQPGQIPAQPSGSPPAELAGARASAVQPSPPAPSIAAPAASQAPAAEPTAPPDAPTAAASPAASGPVDEAAQFIAAAEQALRRPAGVDDAIVQLESAVRANDANAELHALLAIGYMQRLRWSDVAREAERAIELDPNSALAYSTRSRARSAQGELDQALADADKAIELDPELSLGYTALSYAHTAQAEDAGDAKMLDTALGKADTAAKSASDENSYSQDEAHGARANAFHARYLLNGLGKDFDQAIEAYRRAVGGELQLGWQYARLGSILSAAGRFDEARTALDQAVARDPALPGAHEARGWLQFQQGEYDAAIDSFTQAIQLSADEVTPEMYYGRAIAHHANSAVDGKDRAGELNAAYTDLGKATELDNDEGWYWYELGAVKKKLFADSDPSHTSAFTALRTAIGHFEGELQSSPDNADTHEGLGRTYYELEEYDKAIGGFDAAIAIQPQNPAAHLGKAYTLNAHGDSAGACDALAYGISKRRHRTDTTLEVARSVLGCQ